MFFTREDILAIQHGLSKYAVKDSQFPHAKTPISNNDIITMVQEGRNVKIRIIDFLEQLHLISQDDFLNVSVKFDETSLSITQAARLVPIRSRKIGLVITFENEQGKWEIWQYNSHNLTQWNNPEAWENVKVPINSIAVPDEEDLTLVEKNDRSIVKFKDKNYSPLEYSGLGRKYLRKNVVSVKDSTTEQMVTKNILTQRMFNKENTIYIIQYDYDLNGETVIVPDNCVLKFEGGKIKNGTLQVSNQTQLIGHKCLSEDIVLGGWIDTLDISIFDFQDLSKVLKSGLEVTNHIFIPIGRYNASSTINITGNKTIEGQGSKTNIFYLGDSILFNVTGLYNYFKNFSVFTNNTADTENYGIVEDGNVTAFYHNQKCQYTYYSNIAIRRFNRGISLYNKTWTCFIDKCILHNNNYGIFCASNGEEVNNIHISNTAIQSCKTAIQLCSGFGQCLDNCYIELNGKGVQKYDTGDLSISNTYFERQREFDIKTYYSNHRPDSLRISNCYFFIYGTDAYSRQYNIETKSLYSTISDCYVYHLSSSTFNDDYRFIANYPNPCCTKISNLQISETLSNKVYKDSVALRNDDDMSPSGSVFGRLIMSNRVANLSSCTDYTRFLLENPIKDEQDNTIHVTLPTAENFKYGDGAEITIVFKSITDVDDSSVVRFEANHTINNMVVIPVSILEIGKPYRFYLSGVNWNMEKLVYRDYDSNLWRNQDSTLRSKVTII